MSEKATNKMVQKWYNEFNSRFFEGRLPPDIEVRFAVTDDDKDQLGDDCAGVYVHSLKLILLDSYIREYWKVLKYSLLHEMVHVRWPDHVSHEDTADHGMIFQREIVRLFEAGGYDGLL